MEIRQRVRDVVLEEGSALVKVSRVPDRPGIAARLFGAIAAAGIGVDMILQNASVQRTTDMAFTVKREDVAKVRQVLTPVLKEIGAGGLDVRDDVVKAEVVGTGILSDPSYVGHLFRALGSEHVNVLAIGTSEIRISCLIDKADRTKARKALNAAFQVTAAPERA